MSGRQVKRGERGHACWHRQPKDAPPPIVTAAQRELLRSRLLGDTAFFLSECVKAGIVSLTQLPCWLEIQERCPDEAQEIGRQAHALGLMT